MDHQKFASSLALIRDERFRQEQLKESGRFKFTCADKEISDFEKLAILAEEFGEVAEACLQTKRLKYYWR